MAPWSCEDRELEIKFRKAVLWVTSQVEENGGG